MKICFIVLLYFMKSSHGANYSVNASYVQKDNLDEIKVYENDLLEYHFNCTFFDKRESDVRVTSEDFLIASLIENGSVLLSQQNFQCLNGTANVLIKGGHLGITILNFEQHLPMHYSNGTNQMKLKVKTMRRVTLFDELAVFILGPFILINKCAFGAKIDVDVLKRVVTKPAELSLCLITQFVFMPLTAVFLGKVCGLSQVNALALLVSASCPGGGGGYVFSFLINGDITLAITASLVSTLAAMAAMPSVIGIYVTTVEIPNEIIIPYLKILLMLVAIATPISLGMFLRKWRPNFASKLIVIIKPLSLFLIAGGFVFAIVTSRYILYGPPIGVLLAVLLPLTSFLIAIGLARCFFFDWPLSKAVALESGLKNTLLGVAVIELSFPQPEADLASILIIMVTIGQTFISMVWYVLFLIKSKLQNHKEKIKHSGNVTCDDEDCDETVLFLNNEEQ